jgi:transcriptional regulator with XRE-family HTH domain
MVNDHPISKYRKRHGISRSELGDKIGVTDVTVGRWETGTRSVRKAHLRKIEEITGIRPSTILEFEMERAE